MNILWIPHTSWRIPQRAHLFTQALVARHVVHVTDWVADFRTLSDYVSLRYLRNFRYRKQQIGGVTVHGIPRISPALFSPILRRFNQRLFTYWVGRIIRRFSIDSVVGCYVVPPPQARHVVFDVFDDNVGYWSRFGANKEYAREISSVEDEYLEKANAIVASSTALENMARERGCSAPISLIRNPVDVEVHESATGFEVRCERGWNEPVVGVLGNHDKWQEMEKMLRAAWLLREQRIRFVIAGRGSVIRRATNRAKSLGLNNVEFLGYVPWHKAPALLKAFDVGLCPYEKTIGADRATSMRLVSYAASGLPTVCTDLEETRKIGFDNVVLVGDSAEALAEGVTQALRMPRHVPRQIHEFDIRYLSAKYEGVLANGGGWDRY